MAKQELLFDESRLLPYWRLLGLEPLDRQTPPAVLHFSGLCSHHNFGSVRSFCISSPNSWPRSILCHLHCGNALPLHQLLHGHCPRSRVPPIQLQNKPFNALGRSHELNCSVQGTGSLCTRSSWSTKVRIHTPCEALRSPCRSPLPMDGIVDRHTKPSSFHADTCLGDRLHRGLVLHARMVLQAHVFPIPLDTRCESSRYGATSHSATDIGEPARAVDA